MSPSDKVRRKRDDRAYKAKSQFYVDLTDGRISREISLDAQGGDLDSDATTDDSRRSSASGGPPASATDKGETTQDLRSDCQRTSPDSGENTKDNNSNSKIVVQKQNFRRSEGPKRPQRPPPPVPVTAPTNHFHRGVEGRASKSHTQLGVLVVPDSLRESRIYRNRATSHKQGDKSSKRVDDMGATHSIDTMEDEEDEGSSSNTSSGSSCEEEVNSNVNPAVQQQYNVVVSQLCDYLYSTPILPFTHHHYHHHHNYVNSKRPPIQPKPKNIPPPKMVAINNRVRLKGTPVRKRNHTSTDKPTNIIDSNQSSHPLAKGEISDRVKTDKILVKIPSGNDPQSTAEIEERSEEKTPDVVSSSDSRVTGDEAVEKQSREMGGKVAFIGEPSSESSEVEEPIQVCKINTVLEAEVTQRTSVRPCVKLDPQPNTKQNQCDSEIKPQTSPCEPFNNATPTITITSSTTNINSSMSVDQSDTNQLIETVSTLDHNNKDISDSPEVSPKVSPKASPDLNSREKRDKKIFNIAKELMSSERVFVDVLRLLNVDFRNYIYENMAEHLNRTPCPSSSPSSSSSGNNNNINHMNNNNINNNYKVSKNTMQEDDLNKILNYLPQLQNLNELILRDLEGRIADWESHRKISDVIVRTGPFLKLYSAYIKEFESQCRHLEECCHKYPHFAKALKDFEATERCAKLTVRHYMLKPVQRIPQYRLLLEDYLKHLPDDCTDYVDTQTALAVVSNVASHANDAMKQGTNFMKLLALQDRLTGSQNTGDTSVNATSNGVSSPTTATTSTGNAYELIRPGRYLLKEGELLKLCRRGMQPRYYILLSDVLLYTSFITSGPAGALRVNYELPLEGMRVETPKAEDFKNEFSVISTSRSFTLQAKSAEERDEWIQALREAIEDNASRRSTFLRAKIPTYQHPNTYMLGKQAPVWIPDDRVTMCQQCTAEFTITFRRHHCRACGKVVCDHCSANRAPLQYKKNQSLRVCDNCFEILQMEFERRYEGTTEDPQESELRRVSSLKGLFKKGVKEKTQAKKRVPDRLLEVSASDTASQMCGYLRVMVRRSMRRGWFVLKDRVLYEYRAPQDVRALQSLPVLGYEIEAVDKVSEESDGVDNCLTFQLTHPNRPPIVFHTDSPHLAEKWIQAMREAVVLSE